MCAKNTGGELFKKLNISNYLTLLVNLFSVIMNHPPCNYRINDNSSKMLRIINKNSSKIAANNVLNDNNQ